MKPKQVELLARADHLLEPGKSAMAVVFVFRKRRLDPDAYSLLVLTQDEIVVMRSAGAGTSRWQPVEVVRRCPRRLEIVRTRPDWLPESARITLVRVGNREYFVGPGEQPEFLAMRRMLETPEGRGWGRE